MTLHFSAFIMELLFVLDNPYSMLYMSSMFVAPWGWLQFSTKTCRYFYSTTNYMHNFRVYWISLYMFWTVFLSIIRSSRMYTQHQVYVTQVSQLLASEHEMELSSISCPLASSQQNLIGIQIKTPN